MKKAVWGSIVGLLLGLMLAPVAVHAVNGIQGAFSGSVALIPPHRLWFGDFNDSKAVQLQRVGDYTIGFGAAGEHLGSSVSNPDVAGTCTLGTNCAITFTHTYAATPACVATDTTSAAAVKAVTSGGPPVTTLTITGTGTDVIAYHCWAITK